MCASECRFLTRDFASLERGDSSEEGGVVDGDIGDLRPDDSEDIHETTRLRPMVRCATGFAGARAGGRSRRGWKGVSEAVGSGLTSKLE